MFVRRLVALACTALVCSGAAAGPCKPSSTETSSTTETTSAAATSTTSSAPVCDDTNFIQNPSFEDGLTSWTKFGDGRVASNNGDVVAQDGVSYFIESLTEGSFKSVRQQVAGLDAAKSYKLTVHIALGTNQDFGQGSCSLYISANSADLGEPVRLAPGPISQYQVVERTFTPQSTGAFLRFTITSTGLVTAVDALVDNISLTELTRLRATLEAIANKAQRNNVRIVIDAEQSWYQPVIDTLFEEFMQKYNTLDGPATCIASFQAYLRRHPQLLDQRIHRAEGKGYELLFKQVETNASFDPGVEKALAAIADQIKKAGHPKLGVIIATDNSTSIDLGIQLLRKYGFGAPYSCG
ncbi:hypothetical protein AK830_g7020 [Neonectria ditissima]|uniref:Proline dehydrogenase n=1 Tax=Neonectria ditissima TaxID=78410 RepID=A0A0P7BB34_9HYPO|nr:hypothetical protein AK830_g7020 [Neonectria ditissima]